MTTDLLAPSCLAAQGYLARRRHRGPVRRIVVRGERSSGTNFLEALLQQVPGVRSTRLGWKHGLHDGRALAPDLLIVGIVRHWRPWLLSMYRKPWHASRHLHQLPFEQFLCAPWESHFLPPRGAGNSAPEGPPLLADRDPETGRPFANILHLRRRKAADLLAYEARGVNLLLLRYEWLNERPARLTPLLRETFGLPDVPTFRPLSRPFAARYDRFAEERPPPLQDLPEAELPFIRANLDARLEARMGYGLWD
jgi:hypothetical protein